MVFPAQPAILSYPPPPPGFTASTWVKVVKTLLRKLPLNISSIDKIPTAKMIERVPFPMLELFFAYLALLFNFLLLATK